ncbi:MAG: ribonuclease HII [Bacteroidales bacterium]
MSKKELLKTHFDSNLFPQAGIDEAGRGCLAGPVVAAAVILPKNLPRDISLELNDSKKLSAAKRESLRILIEEHAVAFSVQMIDNRIIDEINILNATFKAMHNAIKGLSSVPGLLLVDGNRFSNYENIPHECIIEGDGKYMSIAAASILAKTWRDKYMEDIHKEFPQYCWYRNKGYATPQHCDAISEHGYTDYHRKSFNLKRQLRFAF